jgi:hypothetical protein
MYFSESNGAHNAAAPRVPTTTAPDQLKLKTRCREPYASSGSAVPTTVNTTNGNRLDGGNCLHSEDKTRHVYMSKR